jgi:mannose-6-phosphate isomerase-like protein (cupin superfamily)
MKLISMLAVAALAIPSCAQTADKAEIFSSLDVTSRLASLAESAKGPGGSGATLGDYQSHAIKLSVRTASGGAEVHQHYGDIFLVREGTARLTTGGTVTHAKPGSDGETKGTGIEGGESRAISKGDVVHIPAGTPHQLTIAPGDRFGAIVIKVRE